jgi:biotin transport system substrate-specific component
MASTAAPYSGYSGGQHRVLADLLPLPQSRVRGSVLVLCGAGLTGLAAQLSVPVPGSPVPVTGQTFAVLLVGAALGPRRAATSMALYVLAGLAGVPWFAGASTGSLGMPTLGYLVGFLFAGGVVGACARRRVDRSPWRTALAMVLGNIVIYAFGVSYLALSLHVSAGSAVTLGLWPFLPGDAVKITLASGLLPGIWRLAERS